MDKIKDQEKNISEVKQKTEDSSKNTTTQSKKGFFNINKKNLTIISIISFISFVFLFLGILAFVQPTIQVDKEPEQINFENYVINSDGNYPEFSFKESQKLIFENGKEIIAQNYTAKEDNFKEGENLVTNKFFLDLFFIKFEGKDSVNTEFFVDRTGPKLEMKTILNENGIEYFESDTISMEFISEKEAEFFVNGEKMGSFIEENQIFDIPVVSGENQFEFVAKDGHGNLSNPRKLTFEGVKLVRYSSNDGFKNNISYPEGWVFEEKREDYEYGKQLSVTLKKENATLTIDSFAMLGAVGFTNQSEYCTNNKNLIYDVKEGLIRIKTFDMVKNGEYSYKAVPNPNKFLYKKGFNYSDYEETEDKSEEWIKVVDSYSDEPYSNGRDMEGFLVDEKNTTEAYQACFISVTGFTRGFEHGFETSGTWKLGTYTATIEFEGEINEDLLKEADLIISKTEVGDETQKVL